MTKPLREESSAVQLRWSGRTDRGRVRQNNEDAFLGLRFDASEVHHLGAIGEATTGHFDFAFAVSDGMGGANAGEHASAIAVQKLMTLLPKSYHQAAMGLESGFSDVLEELFERIHRALVFLGQSYEECHGMETTLSLCWFTPGWMYFAHVGDSRIYYLPAGTTGIRQLSHDDTHVGWLLRNGKITERAARSHPRRKVLQKALGGGNQFVTPQVGAVGYEKGDRFFLCTDGVVEGLYDHQLDDLIRGTAFSGPGDGPADRVIQESLSRDGKDNLTAMVVAVD
ncbi:MAG: serine/threonine-protein phosphatase [Verrucomicrobiales bacterium]|nr:serine/threonine-protein phosphatase [Verrucomicrobiales bacterium]